MTPADDPPHDDGDEGLRARFKGPLSVPRDGRGL
jgi:hypothetical protein